MRKPIYPVYIPSKNRADICLTAKAFAEDGVDFKIVVEPSQRETYIKHWGEERILVLPEDNLRVLGSRLWIREHSIANGHARHWQFDDNIRRFSWLNKGKRLRINANVAMSYIEEWTDRWVNVGVSGFEYEFLQARVQRPYRINNKVYSASLINNRMEHKWRLYYNEDVDLCLQVLDAGWCTACITAFGACKARTMTMKGGNTTDLYQGDGRFQMARSLEEVWPEVARTIWRFGRAQHSVNWAKYKDNKLIPNPEIDWDALKNRKTKVSVSIVNEESLNESGKEFLRKFDGTTN